MPGNNRFFLSEIYVNIDGYYQLSNHINPEKNSG